MTEPEKERALILSPAHTSEHSQIKLLEQAKSFHPELDYQFLIIADFPEDYSSGPVADFMKSHPQNLKIIFTESPKSHGENQKLGFMYAIKKGFEFILTVKDPAAISSDSLNKALSTLRQEKLDAVFGSRMNKKLKRSERPRFHMRVLLLNKIISNIQEKLLGIKLYEHNPSCRAYRTSLLSSLPFEFNSSDYKFDSELLVQLAQKTKLIKEVPVEEKRGPGFSLLREVKIAWSALKVLVSYRLHLMSIYYERKFAVLPGIDKYTAKFGYPSSHDYAIQEVRENSSVLDIGCGNSLVAKKLMAKGCHVEAIDCEEPEGSEKLDRFIKFNLDEPDFPIPIQKFDYILLLDVLEHLSDPERFVYNLRTLSGGKNPQVVVTVPNIGFFVMRIQLALGNFNYGIRGILDLGHRRLFTFSAITELFKQAGYKIFETRGIPAPFPIAIGLNKWSRFLLKANQGLIKILPQLFSYQIFLKVSPYPTLEDILKSGSDEPSIPDAKENN